MLPRKPLHRRELAFGVEIGAAEDLAQAGLPLPPASRSLGGCV
jgi:hypothetical protein